MPTVSNEQIVWVPLENLVVLTLNKIREFHPDSEKYQNLKRSIASKGFNPAMAIFCRPLVDPVTKKEIPNKLEVCNGQHRTEACKELGISPVPCIVRHITDEEMEAWQFSLNESVPTTVGEKAAFFRAFSLRHPELTQQEIANKFDITPTALSQLLRFHKLTPEATALVDSGKLKTTAALTLCTLPATYINEYLEEAMTMPTNEFIEYIKDNRMAINRAIASGEELQKEELKPKLISRDDAVARLKAEKFRLEATDPDSEDYIKVSGRISAMEEFLTIDPASVAAAEAIKNSSKTQKDLERATKRAQEATKVLEELRKKQEAFQVLTAAPDSSMSIA